MLYELLTGHIPFRAKDRVEGARMRLTTDPKPPSTLNPKIPPAIDAFILRLLRRNRDERYASASAVVTDLATLR